jgi:alkylated DNA repair dioxygenase AlkB
MVPSGSNYGSETVDDRRRVSAAAAGTFGPRFSLALSCQDGRLANMDPAAFVMALINAYPPGAPIGRHRDAPHYDIGPATRWQGGT